MPQLGRVNKQPVLWDTWFQRAADAVTKWAGSKWAVLSSILLIVGWLALGPYFNFSDSWSLFINTATTIITFEMCFLILAAQNRQSKALSVKVDELVRSHEQADNTIIALEEKTEHEIDQAAMEIKETVKENLNG